MKLNLKNLSKFGSFILFSTNQFDFLNNEFIEIKVIKQTPAAHKII